MPSIRHVQPRTEPNRKERTDALSAIIHAPQMSGSHVSRSIDIAAWAAWAFRSSRRR